MTTKAKPNLWQRMLEVQKAVDSIGKDAKNPHHGFAYASSGAVLGAIRKAMNDAGVLCNVSVLPESITSKTIPTRNEGTQEVLMATVVLEWINPDAPEERQVQHIPGMGIDAGERAVGKMLTYSEKYGMLKEFHVPTDDADPDSSHTREGASAAPGSPQKENRTEGTGARWLDPRPARFAVTCSVCGDMIEEGEQCEWNGERGGLALNRHPGGQCQDNDGVPKHIREAQDWLKEQDADGNDIPESMKP